MQVNTDNHALWNIVDNETIRNTTGGVAHGQSALQNLRAMGEDTLHAVAFCDRAIEFALKPSLIFHSATNPSALLRVAACLIGVLADIGEIAALPLMLVKNFIDMLAHVIALLFNVKDSQSDGSSDKVKGFSYGDAPSIVHQFAPEAAAIGQGKSWGDAGAYGHWDAGAPTQAALKAPR